jgi:integrase
VPVRTCSPGLLAGFALWLEHGHHRADDSGPGRPAAPGTIRRRLYGAVTALREHGVTVPAGASTQANDTVNAYQRRLAGDGDRRGRGPAPAVSVKQLRAICAELPPTLTGHRDRALLLLGFALAARRDELAHLTVADIADDPHGLLVTVRAAKTGPRTVAVPHGKHAVTCPVTAWHTWTAAAELTGGRAFRAIDRHGHLAASITGQAIGTAITRAADTAGLLVHLTAHSLRAGLATEARRAGHDPLTIARQGGWVDGSPVLFGYIRTVDRWTDNALGDIGL